MTSKEKIIPTHDPKVIILTGLPVLGQSMAEIINNEGIECLSLSFEEVNEERLRELKTTGTVFLVGEPFVDFLARYYDGLTQNQVVALVRKAVPEARVYGLSFFQEISGVDGNIRAENGPENIIEQVKEILGNN